MSENTQTSNDIQINEDQNFSANNENLKKSRDPFTSQEDELLKKIVSIFGAKNWKKISSCLFGRSPKQCRDRYINYLTPGYFKGQWSNDEDLLLVQAFSVYGPKWSTLKKYFPNRSSISIKNRWRYFLCRQYNNEKLEYLKQKEILDEEAKNTNKNQKALVEKDNFEIDLSFMNDVDFE